jgi:hypothetical protein
MIPAVLAIHIQLMSIFFFSFFVSCPLNVNSREALHGVMDRRFAEGRKKRTGGFLSPSVPQLLPFPPF